MEKLRTIAVLIAVYNRWDLTKSTLDQLQTMDKAGFHLEVWVCSDGSTDQTNEELSKNYPWVNLITTSGNKYWAKSMNLVDVESFKSEPDFTLWLNNDTVMSEDFFDAFYRGAENLGNESILVGALSDPISGEKTYSGCVHRFLRGRDLFEFIPPMGTYVEIGMFSGNCVLIPKLVRENLGPISNTYSHGWADMDYGMRAKKLGYRSVLLPDFVGTSPINPLYSIHTDSEIKLAYRIRHAFDRKGYQPLDYLKFCLRALPFWRGLKLYRKNMVRMFIETIEPSLRR